MIALEKELLDRGYSKYTYNVVSRKYYKPDFHIISTMGNLSHSYTKEDQGETPAKLKDEIIIGLHEKDRPVTLIKPFIFVNNVLIVRDDEMNRWLQDTPIDKIINEIELF